LFQTKGFHLVAEPKIKLGDLGLVKQQTIIVYERRTVEESYTLDDFINIIKAI